MPLLAINSANCTCLQYGM